MNIERIQAYSNSIYSQKSGDKIEAESKGSLTAEALDFEGQKRQRKDGGKDSEKREPDTEANKALLSVNCPQEAPHEKVKLHGILEKHLDVIA